MQTLRTYLSWSFAFTCLVCLQIAISLAIHPLYLYQTTSRLRLLIAPGLMAAFAVVFAMAWWTVFRRKPFARAWGIAASLINIQVSLLPLVWPPHSLWNGFLLILGLGVAGLVAFGRKFEQLAPVATTKAPIKISGDGTNESVNKWAQGLVLVAGVAAYHWWRRWLMTTDVPPIENQLYQFIVSIVVGVIIVALHEMGHTLVGLAVGMKLRSLHIGPIGWRIRDGKWEFEFSPKQILVGGGKTGIVPASPDFVGSAYLSMLAAGIVVNFLTGILALRLVALAPAESPIQYGGLLALFGIWSLLLGGVNLVPFRTGANYSDGAQIYQLLSNGPWADLQRVFNMAGASLVTAIRPRDYDIEAILRAASTIKQGSQGLLLKLFAYNHYLDTNRPSEAAKALSDAGSIYNESASDVPPELLTAFVFGSAYICRHASLARQWWTQMEGMKPQKNVDYWLAATALHWIEGNSKEAEECWQEGDTLAQGLPPAGAYDFDRYCYSLLRHALNNPVALGTQASS